MRLADSTLGLLMVAAAAILAFPEPAAADVGRFALVAGNNRGADRDMTLRYAGRDAGRFAALLSELGGFLPQNVVLLEERSAADLRTALAQLNAAIRAQAGGSATNSLLVVYFSGHSDGLTLEFGDERLPFADLRRLIDESPATTKIAFVDACHSGRLVATKGGRPGPSFDLAVAGNLDTDGTAIITSSAALESSQESGEIQGSFFSHYLMSGLRGAADQNRDQRVTLTEVYEYAYARTVVDTARTLSGPQHPVYDYQLTGRGEVVLTDLSRGRAALSFGPDAEGSFVIVDVQRHVMVAELTKAAGESRRLVLRPATYAVAQRRSDTVVAQEIVLGEDADVAVDLSRMREEPLLLAATKGERSSHHRWELVLQYSLSSGVLQSLGATHEGAAGLRVDLGPITLLPKVGIAAARIDDDNLGYSYRMQSYSVGAYVLWRFEYSLLDLFAGLSFSGSYAVQRVADIKDFAGVIGAASGAVGLDIPLYGGFAVQTFWEVGSTFFRSDDRYSQHLVLKGVIGAGYGF